MLQATPRMIDRVYAETGLLVHHLVVNDGGTLGVLRMNHIHVMVAIPREHWRQYHEGIAQNTITPELDDIDKAYTADVIKLITEHKYSITSGLVEHIVTLAARKRRYDDIYRYEWGNDVERGTLVIDYHTDKRILDVTRLFNGAAYNIEYIENVLG